MTTTMPPSSSDFNIAHLFDKRSFLNETTNAQAEKNKSAVSHGNALNLVPTASTAIVSDADHAAMKSTTNQEIYERRVKRCEFSLIGRLILNKGDDPRKLESLKHQLSTVWGLKSQWNLIPSGKGYYYIMLDSMASKSLVWSRGSLNLKPGVFRLQPWVPDFDPYTQQSTNAQLWVRLQALPWEYCDPRTLAKITSCFGVLLCVDNNTLEGTFGHYARVLVDVGLSSPLPQTIGVAQEGHELWAELYFEKISPFCKIYNSVGHHAYICRRNKKPVEVTNQPTKLKMEPEPSHTTPNLGLFTRSKQW